MKIKTSLRARGCVLWLGESSELKLFQENKALSFMRTRIGVGVWGKEVFPSAYCSSRDVQPPSFEVGNITSNYNFQQLKIKVRLASGWEKPAGSSMLCPNFLFPEGHTIQSNLSRSLFGNLFLCNVSWDFFVLLSFVVGLYMLSLGRLLLNLMHTHLNRRFYPTFSPRCHLNHGVIVISY